MRPITPTLLARRPGRLHALSALAFGLVLVLVVSSGFFLGLSAADAHGATTRPGSRTYLCRIDGTHASGDINPSNDACAAAVAMSGKQPLWDWFGVLRSDGAGRTRGFIPDGRLCSGGASKYAGYDLARADWPYTSLTSGSDLTVRYNAWAAHPGEFRLYVTKDGYDPTEPLRWDDLEAEPFSIYEQNSPNGTDSRNGSPDYQWNVNLPDKTGQHIIYSVWSRSDSAETFYGCSDVRFDGGRGDVFGVGAGANPIGAPAPGADADSSPGATADSPATTATVVTRPSTPATSAVSTTSVAPTTSIAPTTSVASTTSIAQAAEAVSLSSTLPPSSVSEPASPQAASSIAGVAASTDLVVVVTPAVAIKQATVEALRSPAGHVTAILEENATVQPATTEVAPLAESTLSAREPTDRLGWIGVLGFALLALLAGLAAGAAGSSSQSLRRLARRVMHRAIPATQPLGPAPPAAPRWPDLQAIRQERPPADGARQ